MRAEKTFTLQFPQRGGDFRHICGVMPMQIDEYFPLYKQGKQTASAGASSARIASALIARNCKIK
jgi:hypothetical protein